MRLPVYEEIRLMTKDKAAALLVPFQVRKARKKAELELCKIEEEIADKENRLRVVCGGPDVDFADIIRLQDQLGILERRVKQYTQIKNDMFPT